MEENQSPNKEASQAISNVRMAILLGMVSLSFFIGFFIMMGTR